MSQPDLVDRLARCSAGANQRVGKAKSVLATGASSADAAGFDNRFSRGSALKLGLLGALSAATGLWKSPQARAQALSRGQCLELCADGYDLYLNSQKKACIDVFAPDSLLEKSDWKALRMALRYGGYSLVKDVAAANLLVGCLVKAQIEARNLLNECVATCRDTCPRRRSLQSSSSSTAPTCELKPPPKSSRPQLPSAPPVAPPSSQPSGCSTLAPPGAVCCAMKAGGEVPCYTGCSKDGDGCCRSLSCD